MALIACPDCRKPVSADARSCPLCGCPVAARVAQREREKEERLAQIAAEKERSDARKMQMLIGLFVVGFLLFAGISSCNRQAPTVKDLYEMDAQSNSISPGINAFEASGHLTLTYSCQITAGKSANVQLVLENTTTSKIVWQKTVFCSETGAPSSKDTVTVPDDNYDVGATVHGNATWTMVITTPAVSATPTPAPVSSSTPAS